MKLLFFVAMQIVLFENFLFEIRHLECSKDAFFFVDLCS